MAGADPIALDNGLHNMRITPFVHLYSVQMNNSLDRTVMRLLSTELGLKSF